MKSYPTGEYLGGHCDEYEDGRHRWFTRGDDELYIIKDIRRDRKLNSDWIIYLCNAWKCKDYICKKKVWAGRLRPRKQ